MVPRMPVGSRVIVGRMLVGDLPTPALVVDAPALERNLATMAAALPAGRMRPHVKAHKCTELARRQLAHGHHTFCCATPRELIGLARAGLRDDLLLANESVDSDRLRAMSALDARVTVAVDSSATVQAAALAGLREVLIDVDVGLPRCGCPPDGAGRIADEARKAGLEVRGVMGYEGHAVGLADRAERIEQTETSMAKLLTAHELVGGDVVSGGGTGTFDINTWVNEIQAGSYALMDTAYGALGLPFERAVHVVATVVSASGPRAVADCGLKALGMDHGNPAIDDAAVWFCSDEHIAFAPEHPVAVGGRVVVWPAHVDPTVAYHERVQLATGASPEAEVIDTWPVDLRGW
jgi:D-serine deaminase-like pyridoxal phosphate-dependent protein